MFHVDPYKLSEEDFARLGAEAIWLTKYNADIASNAFEAPLRKVVSELFGKKK